MTYIKQIMTADSNLYTVVATELSASGWLYVSGTTWRNADNSLVLALSSSPLGANGVWTLQWRSQTFYLYTGQTNTTSSALLGVELSVSQDHFYLSLTGPSVGQVGAADATFGSATTLFFLGRIVPYFDSYVSTANNVVAVGMVNSPPAFNIATTAQAISYHAAYVVGVNGESGVGAEFLTMLPMVQDVPTVGDQPLVHLAGGGVQGFPIAVVDAMVGMRGRIMALFFNQVNYLVSTGDNDKILPNRLTGYIGGERYVVPHPPCVPNTTATTQFYTPFGLTAVLSNRQNGVLPSSWQTNPPQGGPLLMLRRGDGT